MSKSFSTVDLENASLVIEVKGQRLTFVRALGCLAIVIVPIHRRRLHCTEPPEYRSEEEHRSVWTANVSIFVETNNRFNLDPIQIDLFT